MKDLFPMHESLGWIKYGDVAYLLSLYSVNKLMSFVVHCQSFGSCEVSRVLEIKAISLGLLRRTLLTDESAGAACRSVRPSTPRGTPTSAVRTCSPTSRRRCCCGRPSPRLLFVTSGTSSLWETAPEQGGQHAAPPAHQREPRGRRRVHELPRRQDGAELSMVMREWARILRDDGVRVWAVSPGFLATGLGGAGREALLGGGAAGDWARWSAVSAGSSSGTWSRGGTTGMLGKVIRSDKIQPR